jgi:RNA polymerase sigma factor (sigma-70 family)
VADLPGLIAREVRIRFDLSAADFAAHVETLGQAHSRLTGRPVEEHVARLALDDLYLATACSRNDERAWHELSSSHFDFMREFPRRFLPGTAARDVADEVIADLWERGRIRQYEGRSTLRTWLGTVVAHAALNTRKAMARFVSLDPRPSGADQADSAAAEPVEPANDQAAALLRDLLSTAVRELPVENKLLLQLYYEQGLTLEQLGVTLRASSAAISRRLKRTREEVRAAMEALARQRTGASAQVLRDGLDLGRIELDLGKLLGGDPVPTGERHEVV